MYSDCLDQMTELELRLGKLDPLSVLHNRLKKQDEEFSAYEIDVTQVRYHGAVFLTVLILHCNIVSIKLAHLKVKDSSCLKH